MLQAKLGVTGTLTKLTLLTSLTCSMIQTSPKTDLALTFLSHLIRLIVLFIWDNFKSRQFIKTSRLIFLVSPTARKMCNSSRTFFHIYIQIIFPYSTFCYLQRFVGPPPPKKRELLASINKDNRKCSE